MKYRSIEIFIRLLFIIQKDKGYSFTAVDGQFNPDFAFRSCAHTLNVDNPWLLIQFPRAYIVRTIRVLNRDSLPEKLQKLSIRTKLSKDISLIDLNTFQLFGYYDQFTIAGGSRTFHYKYRPHYATTVIFDINAVDAWLTICEIEIWSLKNLAKNKTTSISSIWGNSGGEYAVDGMSSGKYIQQSSCSHTDDLATFPWWKVDLADKSRIFAVSIIGRISYLERLNNLMITVSERDDIPTESMDGLCGGYDGIVPPFTTVRCSNVTTGRYVTVWLRTSPTSNILTLCEVDVFGYYLNESLTFITIILNNTKYEYANNTITKDCNGNFKSITNISSYGIQTFKIQVQSVAIEKFCLIGKLSLMTNYEKHGKEFINECTFLNSNNGYFKERDMFDTCSFQCACSDFHCQSFAVLVKEDLENPLREIFTFLSFQF
ncbi:DgyrCDS14591 [Dimorphilus gyrociliatus]|uniref:DgyrCDS14591 n=1 Tax=Dimorphilus gyrociliatus TaxID=2664684 RepID=A0A7I8WEI0_9ANNE|nr:DgyrCDS14591 [Dimorphilus gyrociliatus]